MLDSGPALPLALLHLRLLRVALAVRGRPVPRGDAHLCTLVAPFDVPDPARGRPRSLATVCRTSPVLNARIANRRVMSAFLQQNFE